MQEYPFISICIPSYKRADFLRRLFDSIAIQDYKDFEVIVTDDSPTEDVYDLCKKFERSFTIKYFKNMDAKGTPENWNEGIRKASGKWIKLMHDDDWFSRSDSLSIFADRALNAKNGFIFCTYHNYFLDKQKIELMKPSFWRLFFIKRNPTALISKNIIGPPSVTMHLNDGCYNYDKRLKWLVDIDFYIQRFSIDKIIHIKTPLINVGMSYHQVTATCFGIADVEVPEYFCFFSKRGFPSLKSILVYDAVWRMLRNLNLTDYEKLVSYSNTNWPRIILEMIADVNRFPRKIIEIGVISKLLMLWSYLRNIRRIRNENICSNN
jgi:glycosyltransferase involved in cell wall biosynthesis